MEELLPGLVRVMEERLGKAGRPLTTIVAICLALGAIAWGLKLFWDNLVWPINVGIRNVSHFTWEELQTILFAFILALAIITIMTYGTHYFLLSRSVKKQLGEIREMLRTVGNEKVSEQVPHKEDSQTG